MAAASFPKIIGSLLAIVNFISVLALSDSERHEHLLTDENGGGKAELKLTTTPNWTGAHKIIVEEIKKVLNPFNITMKEAPISWEGKELLSISCQGPLTPYFPNGELAIEIHQVRDAPTFNHNAIKKMYQVFGACGKTKADFIAFGVLLALVFAIIVALVGVCCYYGSGVRGRAVARGAALLSSSDEVAVPFIESKASDPDADDSKVPIYEPPLLRMSMNQFLSGNQPQTEGIELPELK